MSRIKLVIAAFILVSCTSLSKSPFVMSTTFEGWGQIYTDGARVVAIGEIPDSEMRIRWKGSEAAVAWTIYVQQGDYLIIEDMQAHHLAYEVPLPAWAKDLIPNKELRKLRLRGIALSFEDPQ